MGANSSSLGDLGTNEHLLRLTGSESITSNDPYWNQLLSYTFHIPHNSNDHRLVEESAGLLLKNFAINNCQTGNFSALVQVFLSRATELKASTQCDNNIFIWQTYNALSIIRNVCKYFVENLSEEVIIQQFSIVSHEEDGKNTNSLALAEDLLNSLIQILVDVPVLKVTYALHLEALNTILVLLSIQMFQPNPACMSVIYKYLMQGKCAIHACLLMKALLQNYIDHELCPLELIKSDGNHGALYGITTAVASGLWSVLTLGMASKSTTPDPSQGVAESSDTPQPLIAEQSLHLILVLAHHCTSDAIVVNPYRQALFSFTNSQDQSESSTPTQAVATFKVDFSALYNTLCKTLHGDQATLFLYMLLHKNIAMKSFILTRTSIDLVVLPILKTLYHAPEKNSHHIYMALIVLLILSEDEYFNKAVHEINLKGVTWFKERTMHEITLGGLLVLVVIRTIQFNMTRMRDKYLHTNCLAALANMSAQFCNLHPYVTQRLVNLFGLMLKKHNRLVDQLRHNAMLNNMSRDSGSENETDYVQDLSVLEEVIRMLLEIINSTLTHSLHHNPNLLYTLLYKKELFSAFRTHPSFQDLIQNIDTVLNYFQTRLDELHKSPSVPEVLESIKRGAISFKKDKLKKFPELRFRYVEEDQPEEFFVPYVWSLIYHYSRLYFNSSRIQLLSILPSPTDNNSHEPDWEHATQQQQIANQSGDHTTNSETTSEETTAPT